MNALGYKKLGYNGRPLPHDYIEAYRAFACNSVEDYEKKRHHPNKTRIKSEDFLLKNMFIYLVRRPMPLGCRPYVPLIEKSSWVLSALDNSDASLNKLKAMAKQAEEEHHCSEFKIAEVTTSLNGVHSTTKYAVPSEEYLCPCCQKFGHHFVDACFLFDRDEVQKGFGANKFGVSKGPTLTDIQTFKLFHARSNAVKNDAART